MKDVTLLIAHADDEALFAWPVLDRVKHIVCVSSDLNNPERQWCRERGECLREVCDLLGCDLDLHHYDSEFYRLPTRDGRLKRLAQEIMSSLGHAERIFTHNAHGEYGNLDHILCHHIARTHQVRTGCQVITSDICQEINWLPVSPFPQGRSEKWEPGFPSEPRRFQIDRPLFDRIKAIYDARNCWTWSWDPVSECGLYVL